MKKILRAMAAGLLALTMTFGAVANAYADDPPPNPAQETSTAVITKLVKTLYGTSLPVMDFKFQVEKVSYNYTGTQDLDMMPVIGTDGVVTISFDGAQKLEGTVGGVDTWYLESASLFDTDDFGQAGVYEYRITEIPNTYTEPVGSLYNEKVEFSKAVYTVVVYVKETNGQLEITHVGTTMTTNDENKPINPEDQRKVDPSPGDPESPVPTYSQLIFMNGYEKTLKPTGPGGPDPTDPDDWTLAISKTVSGNFSATNIDFDFTLTLFIPSLVVNETKTCMGQKVERRSTGIVTVGDPIQFTSGVAVDLQLKHNQSFVFVDAPTGTGYEVIEHRAAGYIPSVLVTYRPAVGEAQVGEAESAMNSPLSLPHADVDDTLLFVGELGSGAAFNNHRDQIIPTGINLDDMPFYGLILLAAASLVVFAVVKTRRDRNKTAN